MLRMLKEKSSKPWALQRAPQKRTSRAKRSRGHSRGNPNGSGPNFNTGCRLGQGGGFPRHQLDVLQFKSVLTDIYLEIASAPTD